MNFSVTGFDLLVVVVLVTVTVVLGTDLKTVTVLVLDLVDVTDALVEGWMVVIAV